MTDQPPRSRRQFAPQLPPGASPPGMRRHGAAGQSLGLGPGPEKRRRKRGGISMQPGAGPVRFRRQKNHRMGEPALASWQIHGFRGTPCENPYLWSLKLHKRKRPEIQASRTGFACPWRQAIGLHGRRQLRNNPGSAIAGPRGRMRLPGAAGPAGEKGIGRDRRHVIKSLSWYNARIGGAG